MPVSDGVIQAIGLLLTALSAYGVAKFNRSGSKETNQTVGWTNLVAALQKEVSELRKEEDETKVFIRDLDKGNKELGHRMLMLERSRHRWKVWGKRVVEIMEERGITFPPPPEQLDDTDPDMI